MKYRIKIMSGWWKGWTEGGIPMSGKGTKDAIVYDSKVEAIYAFNSIPIIIMADKIVEIKKDK